MLVCLGLALGGCHFGSPGPAEETKHHYDAVATQIEYPDVSVPNGRDLRNTAPPHTVAAGASVPTNLRPLSLAEAIQIALEHSEAMRDLGARVLSSPSTVPTTYDVALNETDPIRGPDAALSAFDAMLSSGIFGGTNDRSLNAFTSGAQSNSYTFGGYFPNGDTTQITKTAATGAQFTVRALADYNNRSSTTENLAASPLPTFLEAGVRQPLLQGAGAEFNRIAGPTAAPGAYNGVLLARLNTDVTLADFEAGVINLLYSVETAYRNLYFAYRNLDAQVTGRNASLETWRYVQRRFQEGAADLQQEARARAQYYTFEVQVTNALSGMPSTGPTATISGMPGVGTTTGLSGGLYAAERQLRFILGLPATDDRLIRPSEDPALAHVAFDWRDSLDQALCRRVELRRQKWVIKQRELQLVAARNFLLPRLDAVADYRWLAGPGGLNTGAGAGTFDPNEWQVGLQFSMPIGNRIGHVAVSNAELLLARERAVFRDQELKVVDDVSGAFAEVDRLYSVVRANFNVVHAAHRELEELNKKFEAGTIPLEFLLEGQIRAAAADSGYYQSLVEYQLAIAQVNAARGTLLEYYGVGLAEGPWPESAAFSAAKESRRFVPKPLDYTFTVPDPVSAGIYRQGAAPAGPEIKAGPAGGQPPGSATVGDRAEPVPAPPPMFPSH
jgi:outer membrane protein TolC